MKGAVFSRRLVWVYTVIVMIPMAVLIITAAEYLLAGEYRKLTDNAGKNLEESAGYITDRITLFCRIESIIGSNHSIADLVFFTNKEDPLPVVTQTRAVSDELERLQNSLPLIYGIRLFLSDRRIPERWPVFFHEDRLFPPPQETWQYHYRTELMGGGPPLAAFSTELVFNKRRIGYLQILMRAADFFPFLYKTDDSGSRNFVYHQGKAVPGPDGREALPPDLAELVLKAAENQSAGALRARKGGPPRLLVWRGVPGADLLLIQDCPTEEVRRSIAVFRIIAGAGIAASTVLLFFVIRFATQKMMKRLYGIMDRMKEVREGSLDTSAAVEGNDEIAGMAQAFNAMVARIRELIAQITREQRLVTETEIKAMQNQINAHFLYNVLETIKMRAELHNQDDIVQSITLLGKMLRYCLRRGIQRVRLEEELAYIRAYISLLNIRNDYTIEANVEVEDRWLGQEIPKMLVQPVVENAFLHAIEPQGEDAVIEIRAQADEDAGILWISVRNFGGGFSAEGRERLETLLASPAPEDAPGGIGLSNIQERLTAFYGPAWKLRIHSEGGSTEIRVPIPLKRSTEAPCR